MDSRYCESFVLAYGRMHIHVRSKVPGVRKVVSSLLLPSFSVDDSCNEPGRHPLFEVEGDDFDASSEKTTRAMHRMPVFAVNKGQLEYVLLEHGDDLVKVIRLSEEGSGHMLWTAIPGQAVMKVRLSGRDFNSFRALARILKFYMGALLIKSGARFMHGSAVSIGEEAFLFLGPKGSGKSCQMYLACSKMNAAFLSDDLICFHTGKDGRFQVKGWPNRVAVDVKMLKMDGMLEKLGGANLRRGSELRRGDLDAGDEPWSVETRKRIYFDADEFKSLTGFNHVAASRPAYLFNLHARKDERCWRIDRLAPPHSIGSIVENFAQPRHLKYLHDFLGMVGVPACLEPAGIAEKILALPIWDVVYGPEINHRFVDFWSELVSCGRSGVSAEARTLSEIGR